MLPAFAAVAVFSCALLPAQQPTFSTDVKVVNVLATVRNKQGQIVRNLTKDDFILEENGRSQVIRYFGQETDLPLTLGLLVDTSLSQARVLEEEREASYAFLDQMLRDKDMAFVIHFEGEVELLQDLTSSRKELETALRTLHVPQLHPTGGGGWPHMMPLQWPGSPGQWPGDAGQWPGSGGGTWPWPGGRRGGRRPWPDRPPQRTAGTGTAVYDAVFLGSDELMRKQHGRKALIILSDGVDNASKVSLETAAEAALRSDTLVYSIVYSDDMAYGPGGGAGGPWGGGGRSRDGKRVLEQLAKQTGGRVFEASKKQTVEQIYTIIQEELRNQYSLGYSPDPDPGPGYRKIRVTAKQKDLTVHAREGYYAQ
ncbi:MAG: VWA domain-containing protein [Acidobacteria bacterium]|nr:VWA domain-containing protein [Acidobacteriota bacterium]